MFSTFLRFYLKEIFCWWSMRRGVGGSSSSSQTQCSAVRSKRLETHQPDREIELCIISVVTKRAADQTSRILAPLHFCHLILIIVFVSFVCIGQKRTWSLQSSMGDVHSCFGVALLLQALDVCYEIRRPQKKSGGTM